MLSLSLAIAAGAAAHSDLPSAPLPRAAAPTLNPAFAERLSREQRLQDLGWRLARGNARFCVDVQPAVGLQLLDTASFRRPAAIREALGLRHEFAVHTAAQDSPSARAGLTQLEPVTHINGFELTSWNAEKPLNWERGERAHKLLETILAKEGKITIGRPAKRDLVITGEPVCATRFELTGEDDVALADGLRVRFSASYPAFEYSDGEFAAVIAHELAHNVLGHRKWLDAHGRKQKHIRMTEREADRLAPWLLANAGFDPESALQFMNRWGPEHGSGIFRKRTHEGWDERADHIAAEIPLVREAMHRDGYADWPKHFRREIEP